MRLALISLKGGSGKTTGAAFLAAELAKRGRTLLVDADPQGSLLAWSVQAEGFDFPVVALPVDDLHKRIKQLEEGYQHIVIDTPPGHIKLVRSALLAVDQVIIPLAPTLIEIDRLRPTLELMADVEGLNEFDVYFLFNRVRRRTSSAVAARQFLAEHMGLPLLKSEIPLWEKYATAFGDKPAASFEYANALREILGEDLMSDPKGKTPEIELVDGLEDMEEVPGELQTAEARELEQLFREAGVKVTHRELRPDELDIEDDVGAGPVAPVRHDGHEAIDATMAGREGELAAPLPQAPLATPPAERPLVIAMPSLVEQSSAFPDPELSDAEALEIAEDLDAEAERGAEAESPAVRVSESDEAEHSPRGQDSPDALTFEQVAALLDRSLVYVEELVSLGTLPAYGDESRLVLRRDLEDYMERRGLRAQFLARLAAAESEEGS